METGLVEWLILGLGVSHAERYTTSLPPYFVVGGSNYFARRIVLLDEVKRIKRCYRQTAISEFVCWETVDTAPANPSAGYHLHPAPDAGC
jgi:hypothetical protein